ncbi:phospholipase A1 member A-like [Episyrphus balteatus]|uniref:phospholipase A1 member A-like n=1 Tax=Episyrphus balteatus TaxID=286459 RepID=UPI002485D8FE|nr:phospholipase A1 member A-like [Episyrphus balteatus]
MSFGNSKLVTFVLLIFVLSVSRHVSGNSLDLVKIIFYFGPTFEDHEIYDLDDVASILKHPKFVHDKTSCYFHGYTNTQNDYSIHLMVESYLKGNDFNLLMVDYAVLVNGSYVSAQENVLKLVPIISDSFLDLIDAGLDVNSLSLVGHSMGAVTIGLIGREIYKKTNGSVLLPRITPLDPPNPEAHAVYILPPVEKTDAKFVDVIHSSAGQRGTSVHTGHADFWPNGGKPIQPGCPEESVNKLCSHSKAYAYWAQSVSKVNSEQLLSHRASNYDEFLENEDNLKREEAVPMGIYCQPSACGDYYLNLNSNYGETGDPTGLPK